MRQAIGYILCGAILTLSILTSLGVTGSVLSGGALVLDSAGANPAAPNSAYQSKFFTKSDGASSVGFYRYYRGNVKRIDTTFTFVDSSRVSSFSAIERMVPIDFGDSVNTISAVTSVFAFRATYNCTIDSIVSMRIGGTSSSMYGTRNRGGSIVALSTANYSNTTSFGAWSLQNNTLQNNDIIRIGINAISGAQEIPIQIYFHRTS